MMYYIKLFSSSSFEYWKIFLDKILGQIMELLNKQINMRFEVQYKGHIQSDIGTKQTKLF
jgi:hypothetical protein